MTDEQIRAIVAEIGVRFPCFGGGVDIRFKTPVSEALKDGELVFAAGVPVEQVVRFVLEEAKKV